MSATVACPSCNTKNRVPVVTGGRPRCARCKTDLPWLVEAAGDELAPALEQLAADLAGTLRVVKVNVDHAPEVSARLGVQGIPTMVLYDGGTEIARQVGALPGHAIRDWVERELA